jgi:16S rRNA (guanine527-N7)-methyltransferase
MQQLNAEQEALLKKHLELVIEANKRTNITRIDDWGQGWLLHVEDSLSGADEVSAAPDGPLADLGSGAGYPGIPLAITTTREITLVESVGKKASLLSGFARELGLDEKIRVYSGRAEQLAQEKAEYFSVVTARALSSLPSLMELASPRKTAPNHTVASSSSTTSPINVAFSATKAAFSVCGYLSLNFNNMLSSPFDLPDPKSSFIHTIA